MGKGALIGAIALSFLAILTIANTQSISRSTQDKQLGFQAGYLAKELAMKGRTLVLSSWVKNGGSNATNFGTIKEHGGSLAILSDSLDLDGSDDEISFTVRGIYDGTVHDVTSRFHWASFPSSALQIKVPDLSLSIAPTATFSNIGAIAIDTQSLEDLEQTLVTDLNLASSLSSLGLGASAIQTEIESALQSAYGSSNIGVLIIDQDLREEFSEDPDGMSFPDQVIHMIEGYVSSHPGTETVLSDASSLPSTFGDSGPTVLRIENDVELVSDLTGEGVLFIEGNFRVPTSVSFNWDGIVVVAPPVVNSSGVVDLDRFIDLSGTVTLNGSLIVAQEGIPNTGHMDFTVFADFYGSWSYPWGAFGSPSDPRWEHTHDFSGIYGTQVGFTSIAPGFPVHASQSKFDAFLGNFSPNDELIFELFNAHNHGLATLTMELAGVGTTSSQVPAGFDDLIKSATDDYETRPIKVSDILHLDIAIHRISSLKKMWDTGNPYPGCSSIVNNKLGSRCVSATHPSRYQAFTLRIHELSGISKTHVYDASFYWHRQESEEDEYEDAMDDLLADIQSQNYGMDINVGDNTTLNFDPNALGILGGGTGFALGSITNLGTWHRHWEANDAENPLYIGL